MPTVRCPCGGNPDCKLCEGAKFYEYQPDSRGWMPFTCPTCQGKHAVNGNEPGKEEPCFTCKGSGTIDPANPPFTPGWWGALRIGWKIFFGGG